MGNVNKTIFIGVGGSGGTTLRYLYQELLNGLRERGWTGDLPDCWQFLLIDVAGRPDGIRGDVPNVLTEQADFFGMAQEPAAWDNFLKMVPITQSNAVSGWFPEPPLPGTPSKGAGQFRALGRLVAVTQLAELQRRVSVLNTKLGQADGSLQAVASCLGATAVMGNQASPQVWLISSLGGGSGSGMFLDVSQTLLAMGLDHATLLYTPDVFDDLGRTGGNGGVTPNSMAAASELLSAFENTGPWSDADIALLGAAGINAQLNHRRTGLSHVLVGRQAQGWSFKNQSQVYHASARALSAITLNHTVNEMIQNYVFQNSSQVTRKANYQDLFPPQSPQMVHSELATSIGYAAVSTGRYAFGTYTAERLVSFLLDKIFDDDEAITKLRERNPDEFKRRAQNFSMAAQLFELGMSDQILDAIRGGVVSVISEFTSAVATEAKSLLAMVRLETFSGPDAERELTKNFRSVREQKTATFTSDLSRRAEQWTLIAQANLLSTVVASTTNEGLGMTIAYLDQMVEDLNAAAVELKGSSANWLNRSLAEHQDAAPITEGFEVKRKEMAADLEGRTHAFTAEMIEDFVKGAVVPLKVTLEAERARFRGDVQVESMKDRRESLAVDHPEGIVPVHLQPAENEFYLEETLTFKKTFDWLLGQQVFNLAPGVAVERAANEVLAGKWVGQPDQDGLNAVMAQQLGAFANQSFIRVLTPWTSSVFGVATTAHPAPGKYSLRLNFDDLYQTAMRWQRERTGVGTFTQMSLGELINDPAHPEVMADFIAKFELALAKSDCMIQIDGDALQELTGMPNMDVKKDVSVTKIPVAAQDDQLSQNAQQLVNALMQYAKMPQAAAVGYLNGKGTSRVEIITVAKERAPATVYKSIAEPITQRVLEVQANPGLRQSYSTLRRARGLASFVPVAPPVLESMIRGWTVARILGYIPTEGVAAYMASNGFGEIRLFDPEAPIASGHYWSFPQVALRGANPGQRFEDTEVLPALLEAMILGYASITSGGLRAYARLAQLGGANNAELEHWVTTGEVKAEATTNPGVGVWSTWTDAATPQERKELLLKDVQGRLDRVAAQMKITYTLETVPQATRYWELREVYKSALGSLQTTVANI